jgi:adenylate cyclase
MGRAHGSGSGGWRGIGGWCDALRPYRRHPRRLLGAAALSVVITALLLAFLEAGWLEHPEMALLDARLRARGPQPAPPELLIVALDDRTMEGAGRLSPVPRALLARIVRRLAEGGARTIVLDVLLPDRLPGTEDGALRDALLEAGNVVLPVARGERGRLSPPAPFFAEVAAGAGLAHVESAAVDQVARWHRPVHEGVPSLALAATAQFMGRNPAALPAERGRPAPLRDPEGRALIDFLGPPGTVPVVSGADVLKGRLAQKELRGKLALVGGTWGSARDVHWVPLARRGIGPEGRMMSGVELQAHCIASLLHPRPLRPAPPWAAALGLLFTVLAVSGVVVQFRPTAALLLSLAIGVAWLSAGWWLFARERLYVPLAAPLAGIVMAYLASALVTERRALHLRRHFRRYVGRDLADRIAEMSDAEIGRMGRERVVTLLFSDIRGYTRFSSTLPPGTIVQFLNRYFERMTAAALSHDGFVDKYIGDGLMVVFGMFSRDESGAEGAADAVRAALAMRAELEALQREDPAFREIAIGIGLHTGRVIIGDLGPPERTDFTAIGSPVNLASRIESETKGVLEAHRQCGSSPAAVMLMSDVTYRHVEGIAHARLLGPAVVRGLENEEVRLWELVKVVES